ncbi:MAG TPA: GTP-binding protein [Bacteroidetes bacterium]|nr:GTP-binding protein [Bacteroidota bacterium]
MLLTDQELKHKRYEIKNTANNLKKILQKINYSDEDAIVEDVLNGLEEPFMFVVVGEVKSGKSSFINALLDPGKEICKVAPSPMTDTIQEIVYGVPEREESVSPFLKKIYENNEILKEIAVVDTPGTNTIVDHHQEITEKFIPVSDLIIFVFEAKNPYRQSAWTFFDFIKDEWKKKIIFVLQQKDLMNDEDLKINFEGVKDFAIKKGISSPLVFAVSAKQEIEGKTDVSGFSDLRKYIEQHITKGKSPILKLEASVDTLMNIVEKLNEGMKLRISQYEADMKFRQEVRDILNKQEEKTNLQTDILIDSLLAKYDKIAGQYEQLLSDRLGFFSLVANSFKSLFDRSENLGRWLKNFTDKLESDLQNSMGKNLNEGIKDIAENIQIMAKLVDAKLRSNKTILTKDNQIFSDLAEKRANILKDLMNTFSNFLNREENFYDKDIMSKYGDISPDLLKGSGLAAIGIVLAALTHGIVFDITGGVLTTLGLVFAGVGIGLKRKKVLSGFKSELARGRTKLREEISDKMKNYVSKIKTKIDENFFRFDTYLENEKKEIEAIEESKHEIEEKFNNIKSELVQKLETTEM